MVAVSRSKLASKDAKDILPGVVRLTVGERDLSLNFSGKVEVL